MNRELYTSILTFSTTIACYFLHLNFIIYLGVFFLFHYCFIIRRAYLDIKFKKNKESMISEKITIYKNIFG